MEYNFTVSPQDALRRVDSFLCEKIGKRYSRTFIQRLIVNKDVLLNNIPVKCHHKVNTGDNIHIGLPESQPARIKPEKISLKIIYEDNDILIIDKPSGLAVHPGAGCRAGTLVNALLTHTKNLSNVSPERPGIVHRLDKETSGVMVIAKNNFAHLNLFKQFQAHTVKKTYVAIAQGNVEFDEGIIDLPIGRHKRDFRRQAVRFVNSRSALTRYKVLRRFGELTLLELIPQTGRTHQVRVHLAHIGYPIAGDVKYGKPSNFKRLALHAKELGFIHPATGENVSFSCEPPPDFAKQSA
jgi:23S rRNA pseudouridine1911/1915/1917 synthase